MSFGICCAGNFVPVARQPKVIFHHCAASLHSGKKTPMRRSFLRSLSLVLLTSVLLVGCESSPLGVFKPGTGLRGSSHSAGPRKGSLSSKIDGLLHPSGGSGTKLGNTYY